MVVSRLRATMLIRSADHPANIVLRHGLAKEETLNAVAPLLPQELKMSLCLDTLCQHGDVEASAE